MITSSGALCILCAFISTANGVRLSACVNGLLTINETLSSYDILCDMIDTSRLVEWTLNRPTTNAVALGSCSGNGSCQPTKPGQFDLSRSGGSSTLTIAQSQYSSIGTFSISCAGKEDPVIPACGLNIVNPPVVTCTANFTSGSWTLNIECVLTGTYSSRDTYWCTAYRGQSQISQPPIIDNQTYSPTVNRQGSCSLSVNKLGGVTSVPGDIQLYFRVDVYPGPTSVVQGPLSIVHPIEPTITCPAIVEENAPFTCTCSTSKIGHPQGRLWWSGTLSVNVTGNYGDSSLATPSLTLTRQDHGATNLTCEVMWAEGTYRRIYTANVSYKAENLQLIINSFTQPNVTVNENDTVTFTCNAAARPVATMVLEKEGKSNLSTSESPLDYKLSMAKCEDTGRYRCFAGNILGQSATLTKLLLVNCIPRSDTVDLGELNFQNRSLQIPFIVTAYPMPLNFSFTYIGPNGTDPPVVIVNIDLSASCTPESGLIMFTCTLTVSNVTSPNAQGHYVVTVGNTAGRQDYTFYLLYNGLSISPCGEDGVAQVQEGAVSTFYCQGLQASQVVNWRFRYDNISLGEASAGQCPQVSSGPCQQGDLGPSFTLSRPNDTDSVMIVDPAKVEENRNMTFQGTLLCFTSEVNIVLCQIDLIEAAQASCSVQFLSHPTWQVLGSCTMNTTLSSRDRYSCKWYRTLEGSYEEFRKETAYNASTKVCYYHDLLPTVQGYYSYTIKVTPGDVSFPGVFSTNQNEIKNPGSSAIITGCGVYMPEFSRAVCTCSTASVGKPPGRLVWSNASSEVVVGEEGDTSLQMTLSALPRGDHVFTCRVAWITNVTLTAVTVQVGFKPESLVMRIGSTGQTSVTVRENETVELTCQANARPVAAMTLELLDSGLVSSGQSPLVHRIERARCEDTGQYACSATNSFGQADTVIVRSLTVTCSPRSEVTNLGLMNFQQRPILTPFEVIAFPAPELTPSFKFLGASGSAAPVEVADVFLSGKCESGAKDNKFRCYLVILNVTSVRAVGYYSFKLTNQEGQQEYRFQIVISEPSVTSGDQSRDTAGSTTYSAGVVIGLAVALGVVLFMNLIFIAVCFFRKGKSSLPCHVKKETSGEEISDDIAMQNRISCNSTQPKDAGLYDRVRASDITDKAPYTQLGPQGTTESRDDDSVYESPN